MAATHLAVRKRKEKRNAQMSWLLENFTEPCYTPDCTNNMASLSNSFQINNNIDKDLIGYNPCGVTMALINYEPKNTKALEMSYFGVATFMRSIQPYLPNKLRSKTESHKLWNPRSFEPQNSTPDEDTIELFEQMIDFIMGMKSRIVDDLTCKYLIGGKTQMLEILKRRAKNGWTEKVEQSVEAEVKTDTNVQIVIEDYPDEESKL